MEKLFMANENGISEVSILKENEKYYYVECPTKRRIEKHLEIVYHDCDDNISCYGVTEEDAKNRFNSEIEDKIDICEEKIKKLRTKLI